jgi:hypothetical protein
MSTPPEAVLTLTTFVSRVRQRRVWYDLAAAAIAAAACAVTVALAAWGLSTWISETPALIAAVIAAAGGAAIVIAGRMPYWQERALIDLVEADQPACGNLLVTAHELSHEPLLAPVKPYIRARVLRDAARVAEAIDLDAVLSWRVVANTIGLAAVAVLIASVTLFYVITRALPAAREARASASTGTTTTAAATAGAARSTPPTPPVIHHVEIDVLPPAYMGLASTTTRDPERLDVLAGSRLRVRVDATADEITLALDGLPPQTITNSVNTAAAATAKAGGAAANAASTSNAAGTGNATRKAAVFVRELTLTQSGVLAIGARTRGVDADGAASASALGSASAPASSHRLIALTLTPDLPPTVTITAPGRDLMASDVEQRVRFAINATDDYGLDTLALRYTKVSGSGERFEFKEADLPLTITRASPRKWDGVVERSLRDLHVDVGDMIVYYAIATDRRPGQERAVSDTYVIEIAQTGAAIAGGFAVPKDEDVFAISLNALIQKTEKLHARRAKMPPPEFASASAGLAIEQRMVRSEFLFSMGTHGRVEDEEEEAENSNEIQEGRLHNKGQSELTQAVDLMTLAERHLTDADTGEALKAQRAALAAVQRAQSRQRYFLRTIPIKSRIDQTRRLTGNLSEAASSQHPAPSGAADTHAALLRALLDDCARLSAMLDADVARAKAAATAASAASASAAGPLPGNATELASSIGARLMALDPTSTPLHAAAASLLQVAPLAARGHVDEARAIVRSAAALVVPLAQRASAPPAASLASVSTGGSGRGSGGGAAGDDPGLRGAVVDALRNSSQQPGSAPTAPRPARGRP